MPAAKELFLAAKGILGESKNDYYDELSSFVQHHATHNYIVLLLSNFSLHCNLTLMKRPFDFEE